MGQSNTVKAEAVVDVDPNAVPFKNTTVGRTTRTFLQACTGILIVFVASADFRNFLTNNYPQVAIYLPLAAALVTAIQNGLDKNVKNY